MLFKLIALHKEGIVLTKLEIAELQPHVGDLVIDEWVQGSAFNRVVRRARLLTTDHSVQVDIIPPLFDPQLIKMTRGQMILHGHQIHTWQEKAVHYSQVWVLREVPVG